MSLLGIEAVSLGGFALNVVSGFCTDACKKKINQWTKYTNHDVPRCLREAWQLTLADVTKDAIEANGNTLSSAAIEQIRAAAKAMTTQEACASLFPTDLALTGRELLGMPDHNDPALVAETSRKLVEAFTTAYASRAPAQPPLPPPFLEYLRANIFCPFSRYFIETAFKHDEAARAEIQLQLERWHSQLLIDIKGDTAHIRKRADEIYRAVIERKRPHADTPPNTVPKPSGTFVPRHNITKQIHDALNSPGRTGAVKQAAARAYGGFGKTVAAILYADEYADHYPGGRFFLSMEKQEIATALASLGRFFGVPADAKPDAAAPLVKDALENQVGPDGAPAASLLILDNIVDAAQWDTILKTGLVPRGACRVLITTRADSIPQAQIVRVGKLSDNEAREVYQRFCAHADTRGGAGRDAPSDQTADAVTTLVGGLAVAVAAVAARMKLRPDLSWEAYGAHLANLPINDLPDASPEVRKEIGNEGHALDEHRRTLRVIDDALDSLPAPERRAVEYAALLPEDMAPAAWLIWLLEHDAARPSRAADGSPDPLKLTLTQEADIPGPPAPGIIEHLDRLDLLLEKAQEGKLLSLHRLWHARANERAGTDGRMGGPLLDSVEMLIYELEERWVGPAIASVPWSEVIALHALSERLAVAGRSTARTAARTAIRRVIPSLPSPHEAIQAQAVSVAQAMGRQVA